MIVPLSVIESVLDEDVAGVTVCHLIGENLLVNGPLDWLANLVSQISNSLDAGIPSVVSVDDTHEVIFGQRLQVEKQVFHGLIEGISFDGASCKQA